MFQWLNYLNFTIITDFMFLKKLVCKKFMNKLLCMFCRLWKNIIIIIIKHDYHVLFCYWFILMNERLTTFLNCLACWFFVSILESIKYFLLYVLFNVGHGIFFPGRFSVANRHAPFCSAMLPLSKSLAPRCPFQRPPPCPFMITRCFLPLLITILISPWPNF